MGFADKVLHNLTPRVLEGEFWESTGQQDSMALFLFLECQLSKSAAETLFCVLFWVHHFWEPPWLISEGVTSPWLRLSEKTWDPNLLRRQTVVSRTRAENQMETCGVHLDGTLVLPAQGRTPRVPVKTAKGSRA